MKLNTAYQEKSKKELLQLLIEKDVHITQQAHLSSFSKESHPGILRSAQLKAIAAKGRLTTIGLPKSTFLRRLLAKMAFYSY